MSERQASREKSVGAAEASAALTSKKSARPLDAFENLDTEMEAETEAEAEAESESESESESEAESESESESEVESEAALAGAALKRQRS